MQESPGSHTSMRPLEPLLKLVNRLQACALAGDNIDAAHRENLPSVWGALPQIVVVGGQSSGKSSVLEAIVGRDFLPRGSGICTRRPLVLQLTCVDEATDTAKFLHKPGQVFDDFAEVRREIDVETDRTLGVGSKAVSSEPIMLSIRSKTVPNLTLVDMPGLTKVATADQPESIVRDIEEMARAFISPPNVVIVAVSPANADIATSHRCYALDGIRLAREVDPNLERTIGVLTKLDLMDRGTDARDVLEGRSLCLEHGWCAVVNRSQQDINANMNMSMARENERKFFLGKPEYAHVNTGTDTLTSILTRVLGTSIRRQVPLIQEVIDKSSAKLEAELETLGRAVPDDRGALMHEVLLSCGAFEKDFAAALDCGQGGGETIRVIFEEKLVGSLKALNIRDFYSMKNVRAVIDAADGYQPHLVAPEMGIRRLIELGLDRLHDPTLQCVRAVDRILQSMVERALDRQPSAAARVYGSDSIHGQSSSNGMAGGKGSRGGNRDSFADALCRFPSLRAEVTNAALSALDRHKREAEAMVTAMVDMEASYFDADFFRHFSPEFDTFKDDSQETSRGGEGAVNGNENGNGTSAVVPASVSAGRDGPNAHLRLIASSVCAYVDAVRARMAKTVPKAVVHCQVLRARGGLLAGFYASLGSRSEEELRGLMKEDPALTQRREACRQRVALLNRARLEISAVV